ncbi:MAG: hypothetical protein H0V79_08880 [Actinobacteria bacterium]|nr:hypothetical protein [Actinomycetota bacterium]
MRGNVALITIVSILVVVPLLLIVFFTAQVPTTFGCSEFVGRSAEARLEYPRGRLLSYAAREGSRDLTGMSNPQSPGLTKYWEIPGDDQEAFRWFDERLQALGWEPLKMYASSQFRQLGSVERGSVIVNGQPRSVEAISLTVLAGNQIREAGPLPVSVGDDRVVLRFIYLITTPDQFPGC